MQPLVQRQERSRLREQTRVRIPHDCRDPHLIKLSMAHYPTKDVERTVNAPPSGWVGAIPTWATNYGRLVKWISRNASNVLLWVRIPHFPPLYAGFIYRLLCESSKLDKAVRPCHPAPIFTLHSFSGRTRHCQCCNAVSIPAWSTNFVGNLSSILRVRNIRLIWKDADDLRRVTEMANGPLCKRVIGEFDSPTRLHLWRVSFASEVHSW